MVSIYLLIFIVCSLLHHLRSLQTGYTCETSLTLTCPKSRTLIILEVTYSTKCTDGSNGTSMYPPSRCIGYYRDRASVQCNGKETCTLDNTLAQRPSFLSGKQANCGFQGQSINVDYSCIPDFDSSKLPRIDICSSQMLEDIKEGFIHTPNYPNNYPNSLSCSKTIPPPDAGHRLKIYVVEFDVEGVSVIRPTGVTRINDWLEINENEGKFYGTREPFTLLFDDVIEASLMFKSDLTNTKQSYHGFLLYFIMTPVRRSRPPTTVSTTTEIMTTTSVIQPKVAGLVIDNPRKNNTGLILLVVLLSGIVIILLAVFLLYKRRNDRRIRYLSETFDSSKSKGSKTATRQSSDNIDETKQNLDIGLLSTSNEDKLLSKYADEKFDHMVHIYSPDPLEKDSGNSNIYEYINDGTVNQQNNYYYKPNENVV